MNGKRENGKNRAVDWKADSYQCARQPGVLQVDLSA